MEKILREICDARAALMREKGLCFGHAVPDERQVPLVRPPLEGLLIAEIKRSSPSAGTIGDITDPVSLAGSYIEGGAGMISVLTEELRFGGSLADLMAVKEAHPEIAVLRKDFIQHPDEVDVAYRAGADAVLVITAMFKSEPEEFTMMQAIYTRAIERGLLPLVEVHDADEMALARRLEPAPGLIGINARNLATFRIDRNYPLALARHAGNARLVYESGIECGYDAFVAGASGFSACLVGTSLVKHGDPVQGARSIVCGLRAGMNRKNAFFADIAREYFEGSGVLVKICGLTREEDVRLAESLGAGALGFIAAKQSPRCLSPERITELARTARVHTVAVITEPDELIYALARNGVISAVQLHGNDFNDSDFADADFLWFRAVSAGSAEDLHQTASRLLLVDSKAGGGSGQRVPEAALGEILAAINKTDAIPALAGGITADNAADIVQRYPFPVIDMSSGVEDSPGIKNEMKLRKLFDSLKGCTRGGIHE